MLLGEHDGRQLSRQFACLTGNPRGIDTSLACLLLRTRSLLMPLHSQLRGSSLRASTLPHTSMLLRAFGAAPSMSGTRAHCRKPSGSHHTYRQRVRGWWMPLTWFFFLGVLGAWCVEPAHALPILDNDDGGTASISVQVSGPSLATLCATSVTFSATATSPTAASMSFDWSASAAGPVSVLALTTFLLTLASGAAGNLTLLRV